MAPNQVSQPDDGIILAELKVAGTEFGLTEQLVDDFALRRVQVFGNFSEDPGERPHLEKILVRDGHVVFAVGVCREADVASCLTGYLVAELRQCFRQLSPQISRGSSGVIPR